MGFMTTNYADNKQKGNYAPLPQNEYEMIINGAHEKTTPKGSEAFTIDLLVRGDLDNVPALLDTNKKFHGRHVFNDIWKTTINGEYQYDTKKFQYILDAVGVPENTPINSVEDLITLIIGKPVLVFTKVEDNTYNGETKQINTVAPWGYKPTNYAMAETATIDIADDDLPF